MHDVLVTLAKIFTLPLVFVLNLAGYSPEIQQPEVSSRSNIEQVSFGDFNPSGGGTYRLRSSIGLSDTVVRLSSFKEPVSNIPYTMSYLNTSIGYGTLGPQTNSSEFVSFTGITQNADGSANLTGVVRGLTRTPAGSLCTASSTLAQPHAGQSIFILSDSPCLFAEYAVKRNNEAITGQWTYNTVLPTTSLSATTSQQFVNKATLDATVNQGAATSTETVGGIVELGTLAEQASSFDGGVDKPTVLQTKNSTSTCQIVGSYNIVASSTTGKMDKNCFDASLNYAFTGQNSFAASTTFAATTTIKGSSTSTAPLTINGVGYAFPSSNPSATSTLTNYGTGVLTWTSPDWVVLASTTLTGAQSTTTLAFPARTDLKIIIQAYNIAGASNCGFINFNGDNGANYGYALSDMNGTTVTNLTGDTRTVIKVNTNANANNQSMSVVMDISNPTSFKKFVSFKTLTEPGGSAQGPNSVTGHALWNNTSSQITSISFGTGGCSVNGAFTHAAGSRITVYGSAN